MMNQATAKPFYFGAKVEFLHKEKRKPHLQNKQFFLLGFNNESFAITTWEKKDLVSFCVYRENIYEELKFVE